MLNYTDKNMKNLIVIIATLIVGSVQAQDPHFSMVKETPILLNPGNTGVQHDLRAVVNYRKQWAFVDPFETMAFSFDMNTAKSTRKKAYLGVGVTATYDKISTSKMTNTAANLNLSGVLNLDQRNKLSLGLMGGFGQSSADFSKLRWESQYIDGAFNEMASSQELFNSASFTYMDAGAGLVWSFGEGQSYITANDEVKANVGISVFHFGLPTNSYYGSSEMRNTKYVLFANAELGQRNSHLTLIPGLMVAYQGNQKDIVIGNDFRYLIKEGSKYTGFVKQSAVAVGVHYRVMDAVIVNANLNWANYTIGMSYDINVSTLTKASNFRGGFELFLKFVTPNPFQNNYSKSRI